MMMSGALPPASLPAPPGPWWLGLWPVAVPIVWAAALLGVMRDDAIAACPGMPPAACWLIYDPTDFGAFVLRGANAASGRLPGRADEPARIGPNELAAELDRPHPPLAERYYLEYPPAALFVFRLGFLGGLPHVPSPVADAEHFPVAHFVPRTDAERQLWAAFRTAARIYVLIMAAALIGVMVALACGYEPGRAIGPVWLAALPGAVFFALNRFDVLPVLATAVSFLCLGRGRLGWAGVWMAVGVLLKVYPIVFVPIICRYLGPRRGAVWLAAFGFTLAAGFGLSVASVGWEGATRPVLLQMSRPLELQWTLYGRILPVELGRWPVLRLAILAAVIAATVVRRPPNLDSVLRRCGLVLVAFAVLAVFWSPQWLLWFLPILVPLARRDRWLIIAAVGIDLVNYLSFPVLFWVLWGRLGPGGGNVAAEVLIVSRGLLWLGTAALLLRQEWSSRPQSGIAASG